MKTKVVVKANVLYGDVVTTDVLQGEVVETDIIDAVLVPIDNAATAKVQTIMPVLDAKAEIGTVIEGGGEYPFYEGPYETVSKCFRDQSFPTNRKAMTSDFLVKEITYLEAPNTAGGITVTIGEL